MKRVIIVFASGKSKAKGLKRPFGRKRPKLVTSFVFPSNFFVRIQISISLFPRFCQKYNLRQPNDNNNNKDSLMTKTAHEGLNEWFTSESGDET